jgi:hypothetical protein
MAIGLPTNAPRSVQRSVRPLARIARDRTLRLLVLAGWALTLGACSKCDIPTPWEHSSAGATPAACHDTPKPQ